MKAEHWLILGGLAVGGYFAWKYRANITAAVSPDPTVQTIAGNVYGNAPDVPGTISGAVAGVGTGGSSSSAPSIPSQNGALTGQLGTDSYAGGALA